MPFEIESAEDLSAMEKHAVAISLPDPPRVLNVADILALDIPEAKMLIDGIVPEWGASLIVGAPKSCKTVAAVQMAISIASGEAFCGQYRVLNPGPALVLEQDDPSGAGSIKTILQRSRIAVTGIPFHLVERVPFEFGVAFTEWLGDQISKLSLRAVVLDSYTKLRGSRSKGGDIVKMEQNDLGSLDALAKQTRCAILIIHHTSKGASGMHWTQMAAGSFAMTGSTESQIHISRFAELNGNAPERLVQVRGRHSDDLQAVLKFQKESLDLDFVLEGGAAEFYPTLLQLESCFGSNAFSPKDLAHETGWSRATAHRHIGRLHHAGALNKQGYGSYVVAPR